MEKPKRTDVTLQPAKLPTLQELHHDTELAFKNDALNALLSSPPPRSWIKKHPFVNIEVVNEQGQKVKQPLEYISVEKVKFLLTKIFQVWHDEIIEVKSLFNSVVVHIRLKAKNPITGEWICHDGVGAVDVQTKAGASAADLSQINPSAVMKAAPAAAAYALKNAAEKFGPIFGANLQKSDIMPFAGAYMTQEEKQDDKAKVSQDATNAFTATKQGELLDA